VSMRECLSDNGICIIHMENFDALYRDRERFIPTGHSRRSDGSETFIFAIDYFRDRVVFNIVSVIERCGRSQFNVDVVEYNPVPVKKMERLIVRAGFCDVRKYCDFRMTPFGMRDTYDVIYVAEKGPGKQTIIS
ncbi:MAG TPA: class I SAM-dependent methyltransferase, partial [Methanocella sp.]|nr:class I SAM-dependent methyltransferase [Methanocella sp.]